MGSQTGKGLDDLLYQPARFAIMAVLAAADELEFSFVRDTVDISDSLLSRYISQLEEIGYVTVRKGYVGKRPRTWLSLSDLGTTTFAVHMEELRQIAETLDSRVDGRPKV